MQKQPIDSETLNKDFIFFDTAGSGEPCNQSDLEDKRATQAFLRDFIIRLASRIIFVTSKFDQEVQETIADLINYLNKVKKPLIDKNNRLIIIHNMMNITKKRFRF